MNNAIKDNNYLHIPNFISPERARDLANQFISFCNENKLPGDVQIPESQSAYNYHGFLELLCEKTPEISKFLGEPVLPTYTYARVYRNGATLDRHRDRHACEISVTLHLSKDSEWPIYIQKPNGEEIELNLNSGEGMIYRGCVADHWRHRFNGDEYVQVFMHYVRSRGDNAWAVFDKIKEKPEGFVSIEEQEAKKLEALKPPAYKKNLDDYIVEFDDILSPEVCDEIIAEFANGQDWTPTYVGARGSIDRSVRNVDQIGLSEKFVIDKNPEVRQRIDNLLFEAAGRAIRKYNELFPDAHIVQDSGYQLLRYGEGQFYKQHTDSFKEQPRAVSCSFALNDDFEGGGFAFFNNEFRHELKKGSVLMFPSNFMFPHEVLPVTKGTRYSIITWFI